MQNQSYDIIFYSNTIRCFVSFSPLPSMRKVLQTPKLSKHVMSVSRSSLPSLIAGSSILMATLVNRLALTHNLTLPQSRSDILSIAASATLILNGLALTRITDTKLPVPLIGTSLTHVASSLSPQLSDSLTWAANAVLAAIPAVRTVQVVRGGGEVLLRKGLFREGLQGNDKGTGGKAVDKVAADGQGLYVADTKVYPGWRSEFSWAPEATQSILLAGGNGVALCLAADRPRPFVGKDFGWIQAVEDRIEHAVRQESASDEAFET